MLPEVPAGAILNSGICYECDLKARGRSIIEVHHIIGRDVDLTVAIPANLHRAISQRQAARRPILSHNQKSRTSFELH
jgi:hypothetical protein